MRQKSLENGAAGARESRLRQAESLARAQRQALAQVLEGAAQGEILHLLAKAASERCGPRAGAAFVLCDEESDGLSAAAAVNLDRELIDALEALPAVPDGCFRNCWSFPLPSGGGRPLGALVLRPGEPREVDPGEREALDQLAHTAAIVVVQARTVGERDRIRETAGELASDLRGRVGELETLLRTLPVGVFIAHDVACRDITMNHTGAAMLRLPLHANASKTGPERERLGFRVLQNGVEVADEDLPMQRAARSGEEIMNEEYDIQFEDGSAITLLEHALPLYNGENEPRGSVGVFIDVTDRKRAEEELREAARNKDEFLATLAHELRNPLAPICTGLDLINLAGGKSGVVKQSLGMMERQLKQLVRLIDDLLDMSRISRGKIELRRERMDLREAVEQAVEMLRPQCAGKRQDLIVDPGAEALWVRADATRLTQAAGNLIHNASKFSPELTVIEVRLTREGEMAVLRVRDEGIGIEESQRQRIFEMFTQADTSLNRGTSGLGIGLTLVQKLVVMHEGSVEALSEGLGRGSEFVVRLPLLSESDVDS